MVRRCQWYGQFTVPGTYLITYTYTDSSGNSAVPVTRTIQVEDTTPPVITLFGDENVTHLASTTYMDQGAKWNDIVDGNGTADANGTVDSDTPGIYHITYSATDAAGNEARAGCSYDPGESIVMHR